MSIFPVVYCWVEHADKKHVLSKFMHKNTVKRKRKKVLNETLLSKLFSQYTMRNTDKLCDTEKNKLIHQTLNLENCQKK